MDREDIRQALLEKVDKALDDTEAKRQRTGDAAGSSNTAPFATASAETEELLRTQQWCNKQPIVVRQFVQRVLPPKLPDRHGARSMLVKR